MMDVLLVAVAVCLVEAVIWWLLVCPSEEQ